MSNSHLWLYSPNSGHVLEQPGDQEGAREPQGKAVLGECRGGGTQVGSGTNSPFLDPERGELGMIAMWKSVSRHIYTYTLTINFKVKLRNLSEPVPKIFCPIP